MSFDAHKNFASSLVATAPVPAISGTSLVVTAGQSALFPTVPFNATVCPANTMPTPTNAEIVRVTNITGDTLTITRAQESSTARSIVVGDFIGNSITVKDLTDIEVLLDQGVTTVSEVLFAYINLINTGTAKPAILVWKQGGTGTPHLALRNTVGALGPLNPGDTIGAIYFQTTDGTTVNLVSGSIFSEVLSLGTGFVKGRIVFATMDGAGVSISRAYLDSDRFVINTPLTVNSSITTAAPTVGSAGAWKLGQYTAGAAAQAGKVRVNIDGTDYDLLTA